MMREYSSADETRIRELGRLLNGSFDFDKIGENERIVVYEADGQVVGFIDYMKNFEIAEILYIVTSPDCRRCGYGRKLLEYVFNLDGVEKAMLEVRCSNDAVKFYEAMGFKTVRTIRNYCSNGEDALAMEKVI